MSSLQKKNDTFVHSGLISKISGQTITVNLEQNIHCDSCRAKSSCGISESSTKAVEVLKKDKGYFSRIQNADFPLYTKKVLTAIKLRNFNK